jgi:hypothetical protein
MTSNFEPDTPEHAKGEHVEGCSRGHRKSPTSAGQIFFPVITLRRGLQSIPCPSSVVKCAEKPYESWEEKETIGRSQADPTKQVDNKQTSKDKQIHFYTSRCGGTRRLNGSVICKSGGVVTWRRKYFLLRRYMIYCAFWLLVTQHNLSCSATL